MLKPTRSLSGVTPVALLTKPYPCPGNCIFCPNEIKMPKSYLPLEPGAQRALKNDFDPYLQTFNRLAALKNIGHPTDKIEVIILGGTWSVYQENYQIWFVKEILRALNDFGLAQKSLTSTDQIATWDQLKSAQVQNETAVCRMVGLSIETRPDYLTIHEAERLRKLGVTKVQVGLQSLDDKILRLNGRGHTVKEIIEALAILRRFGFKIQAHIMCNLYGSTLLKDQRSYARLFADPRFRPDELKVYPCSLIAGTQLMDYYQNQTWQPYTKDELMKFLTFALKNTPEYCRLSRVIRDIPAEYIVAGNTLSNLREMAEKKLSADKVKLLEIRSREIKNLPFDQTQIKFHSKSYLTQISREYFLQFVAPTKSGVKLLAFLRLSLPHTLSPIDELKNAAIIREIHVYGQAVDLGQKLSGKAQHLGLGTRLIKQAIKIARQHHFQKLLVIAAIGTKNYYRARGFKDGELYLHFKL